MVLSTKLSRLNETLFPERVVKKEREQVVVCVCLREREREGGGGGREGERERERELEVNKKEEEVGKSEPANPLEHASIYRASFSVLFIIPDVIVCLPFIDFTDP